MPLSTNITENTFARWIFYNRQHSKLLILSLLAIIIQFVLFKERYPFPNFLPDSYSYLLAAFNNVDINIWPIGYSRFLRLLSCFTASDTALVLFQYLFLQGTVLYLLFTAMYFFKPPKIVVSILFAGSLLNPLLMHVSNFVSSDALFASLSIIWFTQLLWILFQPSNGIWITHAIVLLLVFTVRYNALYYPLVSILVISYATLNFKKKVGAIAMIILLISSFMLYTVRGYRLKTGRVQFSAFGGWQLASNALFAYAHVKQPQSAITRKLHDLLTVTNKHMDSLFLLAHRPDSVLGIYYLWNEQAPLKQYMHQQYRQDTITDSFKKWASMGPLYSEFGSYLVRNYPLAFLRYYLLPNFKNYYSPEAEFLAEYNMRRDSVDDIAKIWFHYSTHRVYANVSGYKIRLADYFPVALAVINLLFILGYVAVLSMRSYILMDAGLNKALKFFAFLWSINVLFSVMASPVVMRYQVFPMVVTYVFMVQVVAVLVEYACVKDEPRKRTLAI